MKINLYHGTSTLNCESISLNGLSNGTYLTSSFEQAEYYAECAAEEDDSSLKILVVEIDTDNCKADIPSFNEPLSFILKDHDLNEDEWYEAIESGIIPIPHENDWKTSLKYVSNIFYPTLIPIEQINFSDDASLTNNDYDLINEALNTTVKSESSSNKIKP